jgi:ABC-2 type transport system permease protein
MTSFKLGIQRIWLIAKREVVRLCSHPLYFFCMIVAPIGSLFFFISLMQSGLPTNLPIAVVDMDNTSTSRTLIRQLDAFEQTAVAIQTRTFEEARVEMQKGNIYGIFYIPKDFQKEASSGKQPLVSFYTNGSYLIAGSLLFRDMKTISVLAGGAVELQTGQAKGYTEQQIMAQVQPIVLDTHAIGNPWVNYSIYLSNSILPGMLQLLIFLVTVYSIGSEIKYKTSREWLKMGNDSITVSVLGKLLPHTVIFTIIGLLMCAILYGYNSFPLNSGWMPMIAAMFLLVLASQAVGIFMIGILPTVRLGLSFASLFGMLGFSFCGLSFPVSDMYPSLHAVSYLYPLRHYILIYIDQALNGRDLIYTWGEYIWLLGFIILPFLIRKNLKNAMLYFHYMP